MNAGKRNRPKGGKTNQQDEVFDASPEQRSGASDLRQTDAWKTGKSWLNRMWARYIQMLQRTFANMNRFEQETWVTRFCYVVTLGIAVVILQCFYGLLPQALRLFSVPIIAAAGWYIGTRVVAPAMLARLAPYLNND